MRIAPIAVALAVAGVAAVHYSGRISQMAGATAEKLGVDASAHGAVPIDPKTVPPTILGMNISGLTYWTPQEPFYDPIKSHGWITVGPPGGQDLKDQFPRDANGWPQNMPKGQDLTIGIGDSNHISLPADCTISPGWSVQGHLGVTTEQHGTKFVLNRSAQPFSGLLLLKAQVDNARLGELACRPRGVPADRLFRPDFLHDLSPFRILRFMDWMQANYNPPHTWATRPTDQRFSPTGTGVPVEYMVALANAAHSDPWFTLPLDADEEYQRKFATYVRDHLSPDLKVYAELSNEVWNGAFPQSRAATEAGKQLYPTAKDGAETDYYYADRVRAMMAIWSEVFAGQKPRLVRVLANQAAWATRIERSLGHKETWKSVDVVAIAPYFGGMPFNAKGTGAERVNNILAQVPQDIDQSLKWGHEAKAIANRFGLRLVTYEAGSAYDAYEKPLMDDVQATLHDPRFAPLYRSFLDRWGREIGGELVMFDTMGGVWGHMEFTGQDWKAMPKMKALTEFAATLPNARK